MHLQKETGQAQNEEAFRSMGMTADGRFMCCHPGCQKTFCYDEKHRQQCEAIYGFAVNEAFNPHAASQKDDNMYNYQVSSMGHGQWPTLTIYIKLQCNLHQNFNI